MAVTAATSVAGASDSVLEAPARALHLAALARAAGPATRNRRAARPVDHARFAFLDARARDFWRDR